MVYDREKCSQYFKRKYDYMEYEDIYLLYDMAEDMFFNLKYPFDYKIDVNIKQMEMEKHPTWCLRCMQEMIDKNGLSNIVGYSENGINVKFDKAGLSQPLIDEIVAQAKFL